ncbi:MAG: WG repeat-containing protein [Planctomycetaceae bacterium]|jgi:serine/threonine protein kinase|nr:WG repeat-containing protein [Planctomycetaceae bacterium]
MPITQKTIVGNPASLIKPDERFDGDYVLRKLLGQGGMGQVWLADEMFTKNGQEQILRQVCIKIVPPEIQHSEEEMERIKKTFQQTYNLHHTNICPVYALRNDVNHGFYLVMKYVAGQTLNKKRLQLLKQNNKITIDDVKKYLFPVAAALDYAHKNKVIHRDIKPDNILIDENNTPFIIDFGLAAQIHTSLTRVSNAVTSKSGTLIYKAPEQWQGELQDARTDQYSLAVMVYEFLSGRVPFIADNEYLLGFQVLQNTPPKIAELPIHINKVLTKALEKERKKRYKNCCDFIIDITTPKIQKNPIIAFLENIFNKNIKTQTINKDNLKQYDNLQDNNEIQIINKDNFKQHDNLQDNKKTKIINENNFKQNDDLQDNNEIQINDEADLKQDDNLQDNKETPDDDGMNLTILEYNGKCGFRNENGVAVIPATYKNVRNFSEGLAAVAIEANNSFHPRSFFWGFINKKGEIVIPCQYSEVNNFCDGQAIVRLNYNYSGSNTCGIIGKSGEIVVPFIYNEIRQFQEGLAAVQEVCDKKSKWGFIDKKGNVVIEPKYDRAENFKDGLAIVGSDLIGINGVHLRGGSKYGLIDKTGKEITAIKYDKIEKFKGDFAVVTIDGKCGFIDKTGKEITSIKYDKIEDFNGDIAIVCFSGRYGLINNTGKEITLLKYDKITNHFYRKDDGYAEVFLDKKRGFIDKNGNEKWD